MNRKQRMQNTDNGNRLYRIAKEKRLSKHTCENCGQPGGHGVSLGYSLQDIMDGKPEPGYWTCKAKAAS